MSRGLRTLGIEVDELPDGMEIRGGEPNGGVVCTEGDHRIQMSFRVLSMVSGVPILTDGKGAERVSYPMFESHLETLKQRSTGVDMS